jgi:hypothetical protein
VVGEKTLRDLVAEARANEKVFKAKVRTTLRSSYSSYYRQMLPPLLKTLGFKCNNTAYRPVMGALALPGRWLRFNEDYPLSRAVGREGRGAAGTLRSMTHRPPRTTEPGPRQGRCGCDDEIGGRGAA